MNRPPCDRGFQDWSSFVLAEDFGLTARKVTYRVRDVRKSTWILVTCVIVGCRSTAQLDESIDMFEFDIPSALWADLKAEGLLPAEAPTP